MSVARAVAGAVTVGGFFGSLFAGPAVLKAATSTESSEQNNVVALLISSGIYLTFTMTLWACVMIRSHDAPAVDQNRRNLHSPKL